MPNSAAASARKPPSCWSCGLFWSIHCTARSYDARACSRSLELPVGHGQKELIEDCRPRTAAAALSPGRPPPLAIAPHDRRQPQARPSKCRSEEPGPRLSERSRTGWFGILDLRIKRPAQKPGHILSYRRHIRTLLHPLLPDGNGLLPGVHAGQRDAPRVIGRDILGLAADGLLADGDDLLVGSDGFVLRPGLAQRIAQANGSSAPPPRLDRAPCWGNPLPPAC